MYRWGSGFGLPGTKPMAGHHGVAHGYTAVFFATTSRWQENWNGRQEPLLTGSDNFSLGTVSECRTILTGAKIKDLK